MYADVFLRKLVLYEQLRDSIRGAVATMAAAARDRIIGPCGQGMPRSAHLQGRRGTADCEAAPSGCRHCRPTDAEPAVPRV
jgi:hypothetical protein